MILGCGHGPHTEHFPPPRGQLGNTKERGQLFPVVMSTGGAPDYSVGREAGGVKSLAICTTVPARAGGLCCPCANGTPSTPKCEALAGGGPRAPPSPPSLPQVSLRPALAVMGGQGALCHSKDPEKSPWPAPSRHAGGCIIQDSHLLYSESLLIDSRGLFQPLIDKLKGWLLYAAPIISRL